MFFQKLPPDKSFDKDVSEWSDFSHQSMRPGSDFMPHIFSSWYCDCSMTVTLSQHHIATLGTLTANCYSVPVKLINFCITSSVWISMDAVAWDLFSATKAQTEWKNVQEKVSAIVVSGGWWSIKISIMLSEYPDCHWFTFSLKRRHV